MPTITIDMPGESTPDVEVVGGVINVRGTSSGGNLRKVWVAILPDTGSTSPAAPWDLSPEPPNLLTTSTNWEFLGMPCGLGSKIVRAWGAFEGVLSPDVDDQPFVAVQEGSTSGSGSGTPEGRVLVSRACSQRGGVPKTLYLTIESSTCEALVGRVATMRWNGELWKGAIKLPDKTQIPCMLEAVKSSPKGRPADFQVAFGERKPTHPSKVCCDPFLLEWKEKKVVRLGVKGSKICPPGSTAEVSVSE